MKFLPLLALLLAGPALVAQAESFAWGRNTSGYLGDGTTTARDRPVAVDTSGVLAGKTITAIATATGGEHTLVATSDGKVYAWGENGKGQLGDGTTTDALTPVAVDMTGVLSGKTVVAVAAGGEHSLALSSDGKVYSWGRCRFGELGDGFATDRLTPVAVDMTGVLSGKTVTQIRAGRLSSMALSSDGLVFTWGQGSSSELGNGASVASLTPVAVDTSGVLSGKVVTIIGAGQHHFMAITSDGILVAWGYNDEGQIGDGTTTQRASPVAVDTSGVLSGRQIVSIAGGIYHTLALTSDGTLYSWGLNGAFHLLGDGSGASSLVPVAVDMTGALAGKVVTQIAAAEDHNLVLTSDGELFSWGRNTYGGLGTGGTTTAATPVAVDMSGVLAGYTPTALSVGDYMSAVLASPSTTTIAPGNRYAYAANFGWLNWRWSSGSPDAPAIEPTMLHGKVYSANVGWVNLGNGKPAGAGSQYSQTGGDVGVNHDGSGNLSGYAYGASIGWIYFDPAIALPPRVDLVTGNFSGYAYSANCGWINLGSLRTKIKPGADTEIVGGGVTGDGIADAWETERAAAAGYGSSNLNLLGMLPTSDFDQDGVTDRDSTLR